MTSLIGNLSLGLAVLAAAIGGLLAVASAKFESRELLRAARWITASFAALLTLASVALLIALLGNDFTNQYVVHYTERALPLGYKIAAFWAGQEGSLLLWAWLLAVMSLVYVIRNRTMPPGAESAAAITSLSVVNLFFAALMLFAANPFVLMEQIPVDGRGLNPMLQDPAMIAHPPLLFLGYAGYTIPFAITIGALIAGRRDNNWVAGLRRWSLVSWLFLSVGILLGAQWAYVELGWGGYWAWDPVENASLLPWLTGTALLHSIMVQRHRGMLKLWNAGLVALTFVLCIFGTYLTRSGVVSSVHSFGESLIGTFFLAFLLLTIVFSVVMLAVSCGRGLLRSEHSLESLGGREALFLATNILLVGIMLVTLIGTIWPVFGRLFTSAASGQGERTLTAEFYNHWVVPAGMLLVALMAVGPLLVYGKDAGNRLMRGLIVPGIVAAIAVVAFVVNGMRNPWAIICVMVAAVAFTNIVIDFFKTLFAQVHEREQSPLFAALTIFDNNHRRYGAQIVHFGMILIVAGITGSSLFNQKQSFSLAPGQSAQIAGRTITLGGLAEVPHGNYTAVEATLAITDAAGRTETVKPEKRFYQKSEEPNTEVAIQTNWREDVYLTLAGWEADGKVVAIQVIINPLVSWIWVGGLALTLGALLALLPKLTPDGDVVAERGDETNNGATKVTLPRRGVPASSKRRFQNALSIAILAAGSFSMFAGNSSVAVAAGATQPGKPVLPPGHPDISALAAPTSQPTIAMLTIKAIQGTPNGPAVGADPVTIEVYGDGKMLGKVESQLSAAGQVSVSGIPIGGAYQAIVRIKHSGVTFEAMSAMDGVNPQITVPVFETTDHKPDWSLQMRHLVLHPGENGLHVTEILTLNNPGDRAWIGESTGDNSKRTTFELPLSPGVKDLQLVGGFSSATQVDNGKIINVSPLAPGVTQYQLAYVLPVVDGKAELTSTAPANIKTMMVMLPGQGITATADGLEGPKSVNMGQGQSLFFKAANLPAGKTVKLAFNVSAEAMKAAAEDQTATASADGHDHSAPVATADRPFDGATAAKAIAGVGALIVLLFGGAFLFMKSPRKSKRA